MYLMYYVEISDIRIEDLLKTSFVQYGFSHNTIHICSQWGAESFIMIALLSSCIKTQERYPLYLH